MVGPTAEYVESRSNRETDEKILNELAETARQRFTGIFSNKFEIHFIQFLVLRGKKIIGSYSGIRPATEFSDYQIFFDENKNFITVGGIRSTGLSASRIGLNLKQISYFDRSGQILRLRKSGHKSVSFGICESIFEKKSNNQKVDHDVLGRIFVDLKKWHRRIRCKFHIGS